MYIYIYMKLLLAHPMKRTPHFEHLEPTPISYSLLCAFPVSHAASA